MSTLKALSINTKDKFKVVVKQLPVLWPMLEDICKKSTILPEEVSFIVLKLLEIRKNTFINAAIRPEVDYFDSLGIENIQSTSKQVSKS